MKYFDLGYSKLIWTCFIYTPEQGLANQRRCYVCLKPLLAIDWKQAMVVHMREVSMQCHVHFLGGRRGKKFREVINCMVLGIPFNLSRPNCHSKEFDYFENFKNIFLNWYNCNPFPKGLTCILWQTYPFWRIQYPNLTWLCKDSGQPQHLYWPGLPWTIRAGYINSSPWTRWPPFRRRYFQMHFREWKVLYFDLNFTEVCS